MQVTAPPGRPNSSELSTGFSRFNRALGLLTPKNEDWELLIEVLKLGPHPYRFSSCFQKPLFLPVESRALKSRQGSAASRAGCGETLGKAFCAPILRSFNEPGKLQQLLD